MTTRVRGGEARGGLVRGFVRGAVGSGALLGAAAAALAPASAFAEGADEVAVLAPLPALGQGRGEAAVRSDEPLAAGPGASPERGEVSPEGKKYEGLLGPVRPGVMAALAPLPQGFYGIEVGAKFGRWVGGGVQFSTMPTVDVAEVSAGLSTLSVNGRFHPFRGGFYVGAALGRTSVQVEATERGQTARVDASRTFVTPGVGWLYTLPSGLTLGFLNLGVNVPLASSVKTDLPPAAVLLQPDLGQRANDVARPLGRQALPSVELFRIGYLLLAVQAAGPDSLFDARSDRRHSAARSRSAKSL